MSVWSRAINLFRGERVSREIEEELATHVTEGIAEGRDPAEVRKALGPALQTGIFLLFPGSIRCAPISFSAAVSSQRGKLHPPRRSFRSRSRPAPRLPPFD